jgi:hypothetical protein
LFLKRGPNAKKMSRNWIPNHFDISSKIAFLFQLHCKIHRHKRKALIIWICLRCTRDYPIFLRLQLRSYWPNIFKFYSWPSIFWIGTQIYLLLRISITSFLNDNSLQLSSIFSRLILKTINPYLLYFRLIKQIANQIPDDCK